MTNQTGTQMHEYDLSELLGVPSKSVKISNVTTDSRAVKPGDLFVALPGAVFDGRNFIDDAVRRGAVAVLSTPDVDSSTLNVPFIADRNPRRKYAELAARFYQVQPEIQVAVTGTNGKTSIAEFTRQIWQACGYGAASIGTLGVRSDRFNLPGGLTTPDPMQLMSALSTLAHSGISHAAIEASSHGLDQYRLDGVRLDAGAFTNLTRDHLDYHRNFESYFYAKMRLFGELLIPRQTAVIAMDDERSDMVADLAWGRGLSTILVGRNDRCDIRIEKQTVTPLGQELDVSVFGKKIQFALPLIGDFQASNAFVAAGLAIATGINADEAVRCLSALKGVPGRMELIGRTRTGGSVVVDYAHTPAALETALNAARAHDPSRIILVFGCGGDRDRGKRPQMGKIAALLADEVIITDDNPRSEDPAQIRQEILAACDGGIDVGNRASAIKHAIASLKSGDILLVTGKGHEEGQDYGDKVLEYSDLKMIREYLEQEG